MSYKINYSAEEKIKLAKGDSSEKLYEQKTNQRTVRVLTVIAYVLTVSMAAIILSAYYVFLWKPNDASAQGSSASNPKCDNKVIIPENIAIKLANSSEISLESFYEDLIHQLTQLQNEAKDKWGKEKISEFNNFLETQSKKLIREERKMMRRKNNNNKKKFHDDEDLNIDMESSGGDKLVTTIYPSSTADTTANLNDSTIIFDQEQD